MPGCTSKCTRYSKDSINAAWTDIRGHFGPSSISIDSEIYNTDIEEWTEWATSKGRDINDVTLFGKWLIWRLSIGTTDYGNLPSSRNESHIGIKSSPCPYSTAAGEVRTRIMLKLNDTDPLPIKTDHGKYYMKTSNRLSLWGFECTDPNCPYKISNGKPYFYT